MTIFLFSFVIYILMTKEIGILMTKEIGIQNEYIYIFRLNKGNDENIW